MVDNTILSIKFKDDGTIYDECGNTVTKVGNTSITTVDGRKCMYFGGNYLSIPTNSSFNLTGDFTIQCWVWQQKAHMYINYPTLLGTVNEWSSGTLDIQINDSNKTGVALGCYGATEFFISPAIEGNTWHHIYIICKNKRYDVYIDGKKTTSSYKYTNGLNFNSQGRLIIGSKGINNSNGYLYGYVSDLKISTIAKNTNYIKQDNKYYSILESNYDADTQMYKEVDLDNVTLGDDGDFVENLTSEITIGEETFKPIDKFSSSPFSIVSKNNTKKQIVARNSNNALLVANGDIFASKLADNIDSFTLTNATTNNSSIKMAVSFDSGTTWKSYDDVNSKFTDLSITIPNKSYNDMTDEEKTNFNNAKTTILTDGFDSSILSSIDFNSDDIETIRFAYVLNQDLITDTCEMSKLSWQFDAKGDMQKMIEGTEVDIKFCNGIVKVVPKIDTTMMITNYNY